MPTSATFRRQRRRENAFREQEGLCWYCRGQMVIRLQEPGRPVPPDTCTLEHLRPRGHPDRRPGDFRVNVAACYACNQIEGRKHSSALEAGGYNKQLHARPQLGIIGSLMRACVLSSFLLGGCSVTRYSQHGETTVTLLCKNIAPGKWRCSGKRLIWVEYRRD